MKERQERPRICKDKHFRQRYGISAAVVAPQPESPEIPLAVEVDPETIIGKGVSSKDIPAFTETKEYEVIPKYCIFLWAINPQNW